MRFELFSAEVSTMCFNKGSGEKDILGDLAIVKLRRKRRKVEMRM